MVESNPFAGTERALVGRRDGRERGVVKIGFLGKLKIGMAEALGTRVLAEIQEERLDEVCDCVCLIIVFFPLLDT